LAVRAVSRGREFHKFKIQGTTISYKYGETNIYTKYGKQTHKHNGDFGNIILNLQT
jgi:ribosomal protein S19